MRLRRRAGAKLEGLLFSSRPTWNVVPPSVATNFVENLFFALSLLEREGFVVMAHFGTLLGALRYGGMLPWDEDADLYVVRGTPDEIRARTRGLFTAHGLALLDDPRGFFWIRQRPWLAGQGHIGLEHFPERAPGAPRPDHPSDPCVAEDELLPLARYPFHGSWVWGPRDAEAVVQRLYGETATPEALARFRAPEIDPEARAFWRRARGTPEAPTLDWPAISSRFLERARRGPLAHAGVFPWWWWNGAYNIGIKRLRALGARLSR